MEDARLRRIAFVTSRYAALRQGVTRAVWVLCLVAAGTVEYFNIHRGWIGVTFGLLNVFSWAALGIGLWLLSRKWLDRRFGRVQRDFSWLDLLADLWFYLYVLASVADDFVLTGAAWPSMRFLVLGVAACWCAWRLWPYSLHYLLVATISIWLALPFAQLRGDSLELWEVQAFGSVMLAWLVAGLIDLALLFKVLPPRRVEEDVTADA